MDMMDDDADASNTRYSVSMSAFASDPPPAVYGDAYVTHFTLVLRTIACDQPDFRKLYSGRELALAEHFLNRLTPLEQHVYARIFQRKGPWFKTSSLLSYFTRRPWKAANGVVATENEQEESFVDDAVEPALEPACDEAHGGAISVLGRLPEVADHRQVQMTIQTLVNAGLLLTLPLVSPVFMSAEDQETQLSLALEAIKLSATTSELAALWKKLSGGKKASPASTKKSMTSRKSDGFSSATPVATTAVTPPVVPSNGNGNGNGTSKSEIFHALQRLVTTQRRIDGSRIPIAKLMHSIWMENYPLLQQRNSKDDVILVVRISDAARELFSRMHRLFYLQAAHPGNSMSTSMPASARSKSFQQIIQERSGTNPANNLGAGSIPSSSGAQQWPGLLVIFKKIQYPKYEITIQHPIFRSAETYICYEIASRLHRLVSALELEMAIQQTNKEDDRVPPEWVGSGGGGTNTNNHGTNTNEFQPTLAAFQRLASKTPTNGQASPLSVADEWQGRACLQFEKLLASWTSLDALVLEVRKCLRVYSAFHLQAAASDSNDNDTKRPVFYVKCNAGYHLARVLHHASALYEKQRQYARAIEVLRDLLDAPVFLVRKRAHWWDRLALNCEHLKRHAEAKQICEQALHGDPDVIGAGRLAIQRRYERLARRKDLQDIVVDDKSQVAQETKKIVKAADDDDDFINLVSSSDEEDEEEGEQANQEEERLKEEMIKVKDAVSQDNSSPALVMPLLPPPALSSYEYTQNYIVGRPLNKATAEKSRFIGYDDEPCNVEQLVLQFFRTQSDDHDQQESPSSGGGWYGVHCEGRVLTNLFGLFMWDVLYAPVADVFQSAYQAAPLDFGFASVFYEARRAQIDDLVDAIEHKMSMKELLDVLEITWQTHEGEITRFVSWGSDIPIKFHQLVVAAMGNRALARLLKHMATSEEYHRAQNGLPDLLMVRVRRTAPAAVKMDMQMDDVNPHAVDVFKYCEMTHAMNLNDEAARRQRRPQKKEPDNSGASKKEDRGGDAAAAGTAAAAVVVLEDEKKKEEKDDVCELKRSVAQDFCLHGEETTSPWTLELKLVEVKGPRDRLSDQQERWLQLLNQEMGIDTSVMHVVEEEKELEKKKQKKAMTKRPRHSDTKTETTQENELEATSGQKTKKTRRT